MTQPQVQVVVAAHHLQIGCKDPGDKRKGTLSTPSRSMLLVATPEIPLLEHSAMPLEYDIDSASRDLQGVDQLHKFLEINTLVDHG